MDTSNEGHFQPRRNLHRRLLETLARISHVIRSKAQGGPSRAEPRSKQLRPRRRGRASSRKPGKPDADDEGFPSVRESFGERELSFGVLFVYQNQATRRGDSKIRRQRTETGSTFESWKNSHGWSTVQRFSNIEWIKRSYCLCLPRQTSQQKRRLPVGLSGKVLLLTTRETKR